MPEYTLMSLVAVAAVHLVEWRLRTGILRERAFVIAYAIVLFFEVVVDGILTKRPDPIVGYARSEFSGWRFPFDIPVEDYAFGFALVCLSLILWVRSER